VRSEVAAYLSDMKRDLALPQIKIVSGVSLEEYFKGFTECMHTTDVLWTKPSELSFYCGIGIPIIMAPHIGSQEDYNQSWLLEIQAGFPQQDPQYTDQWLLDLVRAGRLDAVETVYNVFDQNPDLELLSAAREHRVAIVARSPFDEGSLTGKMTAETTFPEGDVRRGYFRGDRMKKTADRIEAIRKDLQAASGGAEKDLASVALRFVLRHEAVATTIPGIRSVRQAEANVAVSDHPPLSDAVYEALKKHFWYRVFWLD